jgi:hypothetical protein
MILLLADLPNPITAAGDAIGSAVGGVASSAAKSAFDFFISRFAQMLGDAVQKVTDELLHYLDASTGVSLDAGWFAGPRAHDILAVVATTAGVLLVLFLLLAVIQGLLAGDTTVMLRAAFLEVPVSVFGMLVLFAGATALLGITDALSGAVLASAPQSLARFFAGFTKGPQIEALGFVGLLGVLLFIVTAILLFIELIVRASLLYLLVALAPLGLAVRVWPQLRAVWHGFLRLGVSLIVSKFVVALALGLGAAALGGGGPGNVGAAGPNPNDLGTQAGLTVQGVLVGITLMSLAAFSPFLVLKLVPVVEAALVAQGISRGPMRSAQTGLQAGYYAKGLQRLAGGGPGGGGGAGAPSPAAPPPPGGGGGASTGSNARTPGSGSSPGPAGGGNTRGAASPVGAGSSGGAAGSAAAGASGGGAAAAAGGAGAAAMVPVGAAKAVAARARASASGAGRQKGGPA